MLYLWFCWLFVFVLLWLLTSPFVSFWQITEWLTSSSTRKLSRPFWQMLMSTWKGAPQTRKYHRKSVRMYCLQWLLPVLLIPKPINPLLLYNHAVFMVLYLAGFFLERQPCTICSLAFLVALFLLCYSGLGWCVFWDSDCDTVRCGESLWSITTCKHSLY